MPFRRLLAVLAMALILTGPAVAADWVVLRLRGAVEVMVEEQWVPLKRGDIVANDQMVRTLADGHVDLQRDKELVTLGANTEIRIQQDAETGYTTVLQDFGRVEVDAEARRVKHFEVKTPFLAAVVKGTHFIVTSGNDGASVVVDRGAVAVQSVATERSTTIGVGQTATVKRKSDLIVGGLGPWPAVVDPGIGRTRVVASLSGALGSAPVSGPADGSANGTISAPTAGGPKAGGVLMASTSPGMLTNMAASNSRASADAGPSQPVSLGIVLIGALLGASLGGLALLLRRGL